MRESGQPTTNRDHVRRAPSNGERGEEQITDFERLPDFDFSELRFEEAARRQAILADIERRVAKDGVHAAVASPHRARQFMPFAALDGFTELIKKTEDESMARES